MIAYLRKVIERGTEASSHRFSLVVATITFASSLIGLTVAAIFGHAVADAMWPVCVGLGGCAGYVYGQGAKAETAKQAPPV